MSFRIKTINRGASLAMLLVVGCKPTEFQAIDKPSKIASVGFPVSCEQEKNKVAVLKSSDTNIINLAKNCVSDGKSEKTPTDIVFVVDITASMDDSLNTVKNGVERFAYQLRQDKGWDARFAAIGFRDQVVQTIPFTDEKSLAGVTRTWIANGGEDPQEAGQAALATALQLISKDAEENKARSSASKIVLFIGDAIGFALNGNHKDFSTTELEQAFASVSPTVKSKMRFYHSTATQIEGCVLMTLFGCAKLGVSTELAANGQMTSLAQKIGLPGKSFAFPFTESIMLSEFIDEFVPGKSCSLRSSVARDTGGKEIARGKEDGTLNLPISAMGKPFSVELERCCAVSNSSAAAGSSCTHSKSSIEFKFTK
jgi:hypothetical protein